VRNSKRAGAKQTHRAIEAAGLRFFVLGKPLVLKNGACHKLTNETKGHNRNILRIFSF
jgi:hypothetical protein